MYAISKEAIHRSTQVDGYGVVRRKYSACVSLEAQRLCALAVHQFVECAFIEVRMLINGTDSVGATL